MKTLYKNNDSAIDKNMKMYGNPCLIVRNEALEFNYLLQCNGKNVAYWQHVVANSQGNNEQWSKIKSNNIQSICIHITGYKTPVSAYIDEIISTDVSQEDVFLQCYIIFIHNDIIDIIIINP